MVDFAEALRQRLVASGRRKAVDWTSNVADFISSCLDVDGIPMFRTRFAKRRLDGLVLGICWGVRGAVPSTWFKNVSVEDLQHLEAATGDWQWVLQKYGTEAQKGKRLSRQALRGFAEKRIPALAEARKAKPEAVTLVIRRDRMASVDMLAWQAKVEPDLMQVEAEIERLPEAIIIHVTPEAAKGLSEGTWATLIEWGEEGIIEDLVEGRIEDIINRAVDLLLGPAREVEGRTSTEVRSVMETLIQGRKPDVFLLDGLVVSARVQNGRAELSVDDGSGTLLLVVKPEHLSEELESVVQREDSMALEDALVAENLLAPVRPTQMFLRAVTDGPIHIGPTPMHAMIAKAEE